jgi:hypothetical protein
LLSPGFVEQIKQGFDVTGHIFALFLGNKIPKTINPGEAKKFSGVNFPSINTVNPSHGGLGKL